MTGRPMTTRTARRGRYALAVIAAVAATVIAVVGFALSGGSPGRAFPSLVPAAAPASWPHLTLPNGTAVLSYPPSLSASFVTESLAIETITVLALLIWTALAALPRMADSPGRPSLARPVPPRHRA
jgi:hypothetical protein